MKTASLFIFLCCSTLCSAQLNWGLRQPQDPATLPQSKAEQQTKPARAPTCKPARQELSKAGTNDFIIDSSWYLCDGPTARSSAQSPIAPDIDTHEWHQATVPGTVLTTLVDQGVYPDPYYGLNNLTIPDTLSRMDWWYRTKFELPAEIQADDFLQLTFNGINYRAEVWLNQHLLGTIDGAFARGRFDVTNTICRTRHNTLAVRIIPPANPGIPQEQSSRAGQGPNGGALCLDGATFISSEGWDWMPGIRDRNMGIWQNVTLSRHGAVSVEEVQVIPDLPLPDTTRAELKIKLLLANHTDRVQRARVDLRIDDITLTAHYPIEASAREEVVLTSADFPQLAIDNPRLWWPNGYGEQALYTARITATDNDGRESVKSVHFGIRELEYELAVALPDQSIKSIRLNPLKAYEKGVEIIDRRKRREHPSGVLVPSLTGGLALPGITPIDSESPYIVVLINGQRIFCKGGNWGMDDAMKRVDKERLRPYFELQKGENFNMIRNWTGESTQESFYDLCDEYGLLVFNDFWMSTEGYNLEPLDFNLFGNNIREAVLRYRNHPSIALWCPRNEGYAPEALEQFITTALARLDGTRYYIGNSRTLNTTGSGPWDFKTEEQYFEMAKGFSSEVGTVAVPTYRSLQKMMSPEDQWPIGDVWSYHDWHNAKWPSFNLFEAYMDSCYGQSPDARTFCDLSQLQCFDSYRSIFEGWNSRLWNNASGVLLWMSHPAWPSTIWQTYTWDGETTGAYYGCRKACEPVHIQYNPLTRQVEAINATGHSRNNITASCHIYTLEGEPIASEHRRIDLTADRALSLFPLPELPAGNRLYLLRLVLQQGKTILSQNDYWFNPNGSKLRTALRQLPQARVEIVKGKQKGDRYEFVVRNSSNALAFGVRFSLKDQNSQEYILPAIFSDGYITLLPHESRTICIDRRLEEHEGIEIEGINLKQ